MRLHHEGKTFILASVTLWILASLLMFTFCNISFLNYFVSAIFFSIFLLILWFFRIPNRNFSSNNDAIVAPCDGKVVVIEKVFESEYFQEEMIQISIFMSPLNVHANWYPVNGTVAYTKYHPGKYLVAWHPKSSTENERSTVGVIAHNGKKILVRQIAGMLARKIVTYAKENVQAKLGYEFGFIKFGSRIDIFVPVDTVINVKIGDKTIGGVTEIAQL